MCEKETLLLSSIVTIKESHQIDNLGYEHVIDFAHLANVISH